MVVFTPLNCFQQSIHDATAMVKNGQSVFGVQTTATMLAAERGCELQQK
jgi:hypothetical protein